MDEENQYTHKVRTGALESYKKDQSHSVKAFCGKVWKPELPINIKKPKCPRCFPATTPYAIAA